MDTRLDFGPARALLLTRALRATILVVCLVTAGIAWTLGAPTVAALALVIAAEETWETSVVVAGRPSWTWARNLCKAAPRIVGQLPTCAATWRTPASRAAQAMKACQPNGIESRASARWRRASRNSSSARRP